MEAVPAEGASRGRVFVILLFLSSGHKQAAEGVPVEGWLVEGQLAEGCPEQNGFHQRFYQKGFQPKGIQQSILEGGPSEGSPKAKAESEERPVEGCPAEGPLLFCYLKGFHYFIILNLSIQQKGIQRKEIKQIYGYRCQC